MCANRSSKMCVFQKPLLLLLMSLVTIMAEEVSEVQVSNGNRAFTNSFFNALAKEDGDIIFSPISIHILLSLLYQGAGGSTKDALKKALQIPGPSETADGYHHIISHINAIKNVTLYTANKIYVKDGASLDPQFNAVAKEKFLTEVDPIDFEDGATAAATINSWVSDTTNGKIPELFQSDAFNSDTRLVLVNAIYFKGTWENKFDKEDTRTEPFYADENTEIEVQMMHSTSGFYFKEDQTLDAKVIQLPFTSETVNMIIVLSNERYGIRNLEKIVQEKGIGAISEGLNYESDVILSLPKFKLEKTMDLTGPLAEVGLGSLFSSDAKLTKLLDNGEPLVVSKGVQKAFIEVNEEGAEAAAATGFVVDTLSLHVPTYHEIYVNHPFLLILKEGDNILFYGKIVKPVSGDPNIAPRAQPQYYVPPKYATWENEDIFFKD